MAESNHEQLEEKIARLSKNIQEIQQGSIVEDAKKKRIGYLDITIKIVQIITFFSIVYGSWMLFSFAKYYGVKYTDLAGSNIIVIFGALSATIILTMAIFPSAIILMNYKSAKRLYYLLIYKNKIKLVRKHKLISLVIYNGIISLWPALIMLSTKNSVFCALIAPPVFFILLSIFMRRSNVWKWRILVSIIIQAAMIAFEIILMMITTTYIHIFFKESLDGTNDWLIIFILAIIFFILNTPVFLIGKRERKFKVIVLVSLFIFEMFFILSLPFSNDISKNIARIIELRLGERCFLYNNEFPTEVPSDYRINVPSNKRLIRLKVIANPGNIYYLAKHEEEKASLRIEALHLTMVNCPVDKK